MPTMNADGSFNNAPPITNANVANPTVIQPDGTQTQGPGVTATPKPPPSPPATPVVKAPASTANTMVDPNGDTRGQGQGNTDANGGIWNASTNSYQPADPNQAASDAAARATTAARTSTIAPGMRTPAQLAAAIASSGAQTPAAMDAMYAALGQTPPSAGTSPEAAQALQDATGSPFTSAITLLRSGHSPAQVMQIIDKQDNADTIDFNMADLTAAQNAMNTQGTSQGGTGINMPGGATTGTGTGGNGPGGNSPPAGGGPNTPPVVTSDPNTPPPAGGIVNTGTTITGNTTQGGASPDNPSNGVTAPVGTLDAPPTTDYQPLTQDVNNQSTVAGQLAGILKTGNPLLEAAKAAAMQAANARGLQNSSMATEGGENAIVNSALPIAQQDAQTNNAQALANQDISNQFLSTKLGAQLNLQAAYEAFKQNNVMFDKNAAVQEFINSADHTSAEKIAALQTAAQQALAAGQEQSAQTIAAGQEQSSQTIAGMTIASQQLMQQAGFTQQDQINVTQLQANALNQYTAGVNNINTSTSFATPADRVNALNAYNAIWAGSAMLPPGLNIQQLPTDTTTTGGTTGGPQP